MLERTCPLHLPGKILIVCEQKDKGRLALVLLESSNRDGIRHICCDHSSPSWQYSRGVDDLS